MRNKRNLERVEAGFPKGAIQAGLSRQYGGIHFSKADQDGRALGQQVAPQDWTKAQSYINGTATS